MSESPRCLVVEDSPMMRQLLVFALSRIKGLVVVEAQDGVDALRKLSQERFDIVITDVNMPIMDGLKLVKRIRTDPNHRDVPIVIITTEGADADRKRALELGANSYIVKPIQAPAVISTVKELLRISQAPPVPQAPQGPPDTPPAPQTPPATGNGSNTSSSAP
jgi:two-component system chemotaxis response regulator CheY